MKKIVKQKLLLTAFYIIHVWTAMFTLFAAGVAISPSPESFLSRMQMPAIYLITGWIPYFIFKWFVWLIKDDS